MALALERDQDLVHATVVQVDEVAEPLLEHGVHRIAVQRPLGQQRENRESDRHVQSLFRPAVESDRSARARATHRFK
jgi:hypothetical protein